MANVTQVTLTAGVPTAPSGTVSTLDNLIGTAGSGSTQVLTVQGNASGTPVPVSVSNANANGAAVSANSAPVVIASDQAAVPAKLQATTAGGLTRTRTLIPNNVTAVVVKSGAGQLYKVRCTNNSAVIAYLKIYDATSATAGAGTPVDTIMIPASTSGAGIVDSTDVGTPFATGLTFVVTTGIADADTAVPAASAYIVTMYYK